MKRPLLSSTAPPFRFTSVKALLPPGQGPLAPVAHPSVYASYDNDGNSTTLTVQQLQATVSCAGESTTTASSCSGAATLEEGDFCHQVKRGTITAVNLNWATPAPGKRYGRATPVSPRGLTFHRGIHLSTFGGNFKTVLDSFFFTTNANRSFSDTVDLHLTFQPNHPRDSTATFGAGGWSTTAGNSAAGKLYAVAEQDDGKVVAVGYAYILPRRSFAQARCLSNSWLHNGFRAGSRFATVTGAAEGRAHNLRNPGIRTSGDSRNPLYFVGNNRCRLTNHTPPPLIRGPEPRDNGTERDKTSILQYQGLLACDRELSPTRGIHPGAVPGGRGSGPIEQEGTDLDLASLINQVATLGVGNGAASRSFRSEQRKAKQGPGPYPEQCASTSAQGRRLLPRKPGQPFLSGPGTRGGPGPSWTASAGTLAPRRKKGKAMTSETSKTSFRWPDNYYQAGDGTTLLSVPIWPGCLAENEAQNPLPVDPPVGRGLRPCQPAQPPRRSMEPGSENLQRGNRGGRPPGHPAGNAPPGNADTRSPPARR